jgi:hypothetical protein
MNVFEMLIEAVDDLKSRGYTHNIILNEKGHYCPELHQIFAPDQLQIRECYRFEGPSYPSDNDVLYAIETKDGEERGTLVCPYGVYFDASLAQLLLSLDQAVEMVA